jgi:hypothetical protein
MWLRIWCSGSGYGAVAGSCEHGNEPYSIFCKLFFLQNINIFCFDVTYSKMSRSVYILEDVYIIILNSFYTG